LQYERDLAFKVSIKVGFVAVGEMPCVGFYCAPAVSDSSYLVWCCPWFQSYQQLAIVLVDQVPADYIRHTP